MLAALLLLAPAAPPIPQAGGPPVRGPHAGSLRMIGTAEVGGRAVVLGEELWFDPVTHQPVYDLDVYEVSANGALSIQSSVPSALAPERVYAFGGEHIAVVDDQDVARLLVHAGGTWVEGPPLRQDFILGTYRLYGREVEFDGSRVAHALHAAREVTIHSIVGTAPLLVEAVLPLPPGHVHRGHALDQDLLVVASGTLDSALAGTFTETSFRTFERSPAGLWSEVLPRLSPPAGIDWSNAPISFDASDGRIAIGAGSCGETFIYERGAGSSFQHVSTVRSPRLLEVQPGVCATYPTVTLRGDDLVMVTGMDRAGERYRWDGASWLPREMVRTGEGSVEEYLFAGDYLISTSRHRQTSSYWTSGIQVHAQADEPSGLEVTCTSPAQSSMLRMFVSAPCAFAHRPFSVGVFTESLGLPTVLVAGRAAGARALGSESTLCVGGSPRLLPLTLDPSPAGGGFVQIHLEPNAASIAPGETIYFQAWQRVPGLPGGRTSNGAAAIFAQ